jgi:hypothetical protein
MPASGRYNRQALNKPRPLLAPIQVAPEKSLIVPTRYISRRSSETASDAPNTAPAASTPRPSEPNLNFHLPPSAEVSFIIAFWIRMRVRVRLDSKFSRPRIDFGPSPDFSLLCVRCRSSSCDSIGYHLRLPEPWLSLVSLGLMRVVLNSFLLVTLLGFGCSSQATLLRVKVEYNPTETWRIHYPPGARSRKNGKQRRRETGSSLNSLTLTRGGTSKLSVNG